MSSKNELGGYFRLWSQIWKRWGIATPIRDDFRHRVTEVAIGRPASAKDLSHAEFDIVFRLMRRILAEGPDFVTTESERQAEIEAGRCRRLRFKCEERAPIPYLDDIAQDVFKKSYPELNSEELPKLLATAVNRSKNRDLHSRFRGAATKVQRTERVAQTSDYRP